MGMAKKTGEKKKKGGGGLPNQKTKTDAGTGDSDDERNYISSFITIRNRKLMPDQVTLSTINATHTAQCTFMNDLYSYSCRTY